MKKIFAVALFAAWRNTKMKRFVVALFAITMMCSLGALGQSGPNGVPAPPGYHWVSTFDDEFTQDSAIDTNNWATQGNVYLDGANGIAIVANPSDPTTRVSLCRIAYASGNFCYSNPQGQVYGFWEASYKIPISVGGASDGYHIDFWFRSASNNGEEDVDEYYADLNTSNNYYATNYIHFGTDNQQYTYPSTSVGDLSNAYHTYGMWWYDDGSAYGALQLYFDGQVATPPYDIDGEWTDGAYEKFTIDSCNNGLCDSNTSSNNPWYIQYERVWQLAPD